MPDKYPSLLHRRFDEVWNQQREEAIDEMMTENVVIHGLDEAPIVGRENFKPFYRDFLSAFPDVHIEVHDAITVDDKMSCRCTVTGTNTGEGLGHAPTGKAVEFTGGGLCTVENGKFKEVWNEFDFMKMNLQMNRLRFND